MNCKGRGALMLKLSGRMLQFVVLLLSWLGIWIGDHTSSDPNCFCNCSCHIERVECELPAVSWTWEALKICFFVLLGIGLTAFNIFGRLVALGVELVQGWSQSQRTGPLEIENPISDRPSVSSIRIEQTSQQALAKQQLEILRRRRSQ